MNRATLTTKKIRVRNYFRRRPLANLSPCGHFDQLPKEIIYEIFKYLPLSTIGTLSLTSEAMRILVSGKQYFLRTFEGIYLTLTTFSTIRRQIGSVQWIVLDEVSHAYKQEV